MEGNVTPKPRCAVRQKLMHVGARGIQLERTNKQRKTAIKLGQSLYYILLHIFNECKNEDKSK